MSIPIERPMQDLSNLTIQLEIGVPGKYSTESFVLSESRHLQVTPENSLKLLPILEFLEKHYIHTNSYMVAYYSEKRHIYVFQGQTPLSDSAAIRLEDISTHLGLKLKIRFTSKGSTGQYNQGPGVRDEDEESDQGKSGKRTKERKIGFIIEKVAKWRSMYNGIQNTKGEIVRKIFIFRL